MTLAAAWIALRCGPPYLNRSSPSRHWIVISRLRNLLGWQGNSPSRHLSEPRLQPEERPARSHLAVNLPLRFLGVGAHVLQELGELRGC